MSHKIYFYREGDNKERWHHLDNDIVSDYDDDEEVYTI